MEVVDYKKVEVPKGMKPVVVKQLQSWRTVHPVLKAMEDSPKNLTHLSCLLAEELRNPAGPRAQIMTRLHQRINAMRQRMELAKVVIHAKR